MHSYLKDKKMKQVIVALAFAFGFSIMAEAQTVASVDLKNLEGMIVNPSDLVGKEIQLLFALGYMVQSISRIK